MSVSHLVFLSVSVARVASLAQLSSRGALRAADMPSTRALMVSLSEAGNTTSWNKSRDWLEFVPCRILYKPYYLVTERFMYLRPISTRVSAADTLFLRQIL